jgi:hypothetical protein
MPFGFLLKAVKGIDFDSDELYKSDKHAALIKGMSIEQNENPSASSEGDNAGVFTPNPSNELAIPVPDDFLPEGNNYCIGFKEADNADLCIVWVYNSLQNHFIYVIFADGSAQIVKRDPSFNFQLNPKYFIGPGRAIVFTYCYHNKSTKTEERRTQIVFTDSFGPIHCIVMEDAIATGGFSAAQFPFFDARFYDAATLNNLGLPPSDKCIGIKPIALAPADEALDNDINFVGIQFRIKFIDVWGNESEHSIISDLYFNTTSGCVTKLARCLLLTLNAGRPTVTRIQIEYRLWTANKPDFSVPTDWRLHETVEKYDQNNDSLQWWQRNLNPTLVYDGVENTFEYKFCMEKEWKALPTSETDRIFNPIPITTACVYPANRSLGVANDRKKYPPLSVDLLNKVDFSVELPSPDGKCQPRIVNIDVYAVIWCFKEATVSLIRKDGDLFYFGVDKTDILTEYEQYFPPDQKGWVGYFVGGESVVSEQVRYNKLTAEIEEVPADNFYKDVDGFFERLNYIPLQRFRFKGVLPGTKVFRVASHRSAPADDFRKTSTYAMGITKLEALGTYAAFNEKEIIIDACDPAIADIDLRTRPLMIGDLTSDPGGVRRITNVCTGYLREDETSNIPIEAARIDTTHITDHPATTDHNGFYFAVGRERDWKVKLYGTKKCERNKFLVESSTTLDAPGSRFRKQTLFAYKKPSEYPKADRTLVKGRVTLCDGSSGVSGIPVIIRHGQYGITDADGNFSIVAHDNGDGTIRQEEVLYVQGGKCVLTACGSCSYCLPGGSWLQTPCTGQERISILPNNVVSLQNANARGPQNGGRYPIAIQAFDWLGRTNGAENIAKHILDVPSIQETGIFGFSRFKYKIDPSIIFPDSVDYITFSVAPNINWADFLTWYAEKIDFVDNSGNVNKANPTQIKVWYRSLLEYNLQNAFSTNSVWQVIEEQANKPIKGDKVEFVVNGDGKIFASRISALIKHDQDGNFFLLDYTEALKDLIDGAQIKLIRPKDTSSNDLFFELCKVIKLKDGQVQSKDLEGYLNYFDSYFLNRQIPVPVFDKDGKKDPVLTTLKTIPFPFEHHSPSDFWGDHAANRGRVFTKDKFANTQCLSTEMGVSKAIVNDGVFNGISYFEDKDFKEFDKLEMGGITFVKAFIGGFLVIGEHDNYSIPFDDNAVYMDNQGRAVAKPASDRFGRPERKTNDKLGCQPDDVNTIVDMPFGITFVDSSKSAWVWHTYNEAMQINTLGCTGWLADKIKSAKKFNRESEDFQKYFHSVYDPKRSQVILTMFKLPRPAAVFPQLGIDDYTNDLRDRNIERNESIIFSPVDKVLKQQHHATPEYWGCFSAHSKDKQLISFRNGLPYTHYRGFKPPNQSYLNYFGKQCNWVYWPVANIDQNKVKGYLWTEAHVREVSVFMDQILTQAGQKSRILLSQWDKRDHFWAANFLCDLNTYPDPNIEVLQDPDKIIFEGSDLYGKWISMRLVGDPAQAANYFEFNGIHVFVFAAEKSGIDNK